MGRGSQHTCTTGQDADGDGDCPIKLQYIPIAGSLALDSVQLARSRTKGFDYRSAANTLVLINVGPLPAWWAASYQSWVLP